MTPSVEARSPSEVLLNEAQAKRDAKDWDAALSLYRKGQQNHPDTPNFKWGEIYVLADSGQVDQAVTLAEELLQRHPDDPDVLLVMAYAQFRKHGAFASLKYVNRAMDLPNQRAYVARQYITTLQQAHMPEAALAFVQQHPGLISDEQMLELEVDAIALSVRFTELATRTHEERFVIADEALKRYELLFTKLEQAGPSVNPLYQRARIDRLEALHARHAMQEIVQEYEALLAEGVDIPMYALSNVASAYLYLREPERSAQLYAKLVESGYMRTDEVSRLNLEGGLLYSYSDQGETQISQQMASEFAKEYKPWRYVEGNQLPLANGPYLEAQHRANMMDLYAQDTVKSQSSLESLVSKAPANTSLRSDLATLYRIRGWPRLAEQELKIAENTAPRALNTEVEQGLTALDLQEWHQAKELSEDALKRFPESLRSQRLARLWEVHNMWQLDVSAYKGLSNNNPSYGSKDFGIETTLYSKPLYENWRLLAGFGHRKGSFNEGIGQHNFGRIGLEWRSRDWSVLGEISDNHFGHGSRTGAGLQLSYQIDDYWSLYASAQWRARDSNLRTLYNNITSNKLDFGVSWRESERRSWRLSIAPTEFSDGNRRWDVLLAGQERILTRPKWFMDAGLEVSAAQNRFTNVPYYSPRNEYAVLPSLKVEHIISQRYQTAWTQQFNLAAGALHQKGFGTAAMTQIGYGIRYRTNDVFEAGANLSHLSRPYDGVREHEWRLVFDMTLRF